jgi:tetratricopeptide (TPR) repeat protein
MRYAYCVALLFLSAHALAQTPPTHEQRAAEYYDDAARAYKEGRYEEAIDLLKRAYELSHKAPILQNLGRAYERLGRLEDALDAFKNYLGKDPFAADRATIETEINAIEKQIDQKRALAMAAEAAKAKAEADQKAKADAEARAREEAARRQAAERLAEERRHHASPLPWIVAGVGVAGGINSAIFGALADARHRSASSPTLDQPTAKSTEDEAQTFATVTNVSLVVAGALLVTGVVWGVLDTMAANRAKKRVHTQLTGQLNIHFDLW